MALETANYITDLVITNPTGADAKSTSDDHHRLTKKVLVQSFGGISGPVTATHTQLNYVTGVTSAIQTQLDAKAPLASPTFTGTVTVPSVTVGDSSTKAAPTSFVVASIASVNAQSALVVAVVSGTTQTAVAGSHYVLTNVAATTVTLPASPSSGDQIWVTWANSLSTNVIARNGKTIMGLSEDMTLDAVTNGTVQLRYVNSDWKIL